MVQVVERQKALPQYPFSSFSLFCLLDFDSINELVLLSGRRRTTPHEKAYTRRGEIPERIRPPIYCVDAVLLKLYSGV
jgi:hypothetical protein